MTTLKWNLPGTRKYETGVDRGVLYLPGRPGVPWNGLTAVNESPSGGDAEPRYIDGVKVTNEAKKVEIEGTIEAYTYPDEFELCDGTVEVLSGVFATVQRRVPFGLSYRTRVGNDIEGSSHGYKLHLVYNALAAPSSKGFSSAGAVDSPVTMSWSYTTTPVDAGPTLKPTAHLILDSRKLPASILAVVEERLYGTAATDAYLPSPSEIYGLFVSTGIQITENSVTGLNKIITGTKTDLTNKSAGLFSIPIGSRLVQYSPGLFDLDTGLGV